MYPTTAVIQSPCHQQSPICAWKLMWYAPAARPTPASRAVSTAFRFIQPSKPYSCKMTSHWKRWSYQALMIMQVLAKGVPPSLYYRHRRSGGIIRAKAGYDLLSRYIVGCKRVCAVFNAPPKVNQDNNKSDTIIPINSTSKGNSKLNKQKAIFPVCDASSYMRLWSQSIEESYILIQNVQSFFPNERRLLDMTFILC